jgi:5'-methylthioadenosine phosphorylase
MIRTKLGIIGGSGLYQFPQLENATWKTITSPWGEVSDDLMFGTVEDLEVVFLPRHGRKHRLSPSHINYRANIDALKQSGVTDIISVSACGSLREDLPPGAFLLVDQFIDQTKSRSKSFFGDGIVAHVSFAEPVAGRLVKQLSSIMKSKNIHYQDKGTYICIEGPQFSTRAESQLYRSWGCDVIGMTNLPEVQLAREAEMPYATLAMVTDYDCWHPDHEAVTVEQVASVMSKNTLIAKEILAELASTFPTQRETCPSGADNALDDAIMSNLKYLTPQDRKRFSAIAGRLLERQGAE